MKKTLIVAVVCLSPAAGPALALDQNRTAPIDQGSPIDMSTIGGAPLTSLLRGFSRDGAIVRALPAPVWGSYASPWQPAVFNVGNFPVATTSNGGTIGVVNALTGAVDVPATDTGGPRGKASSAVIGYARTASTKSGAVAVAGFGSLNAENTPGTWGADFGCANSRTSTPGLGTNTGFNAFTCNGIEIDPDIIRATGGATPTGRVNGLIFNGGSEVKPSGGAYGIFINPLGGGVSATVGWDCAICIASGANVLGISVGALNASGGARTSLQSQPIRLYSYNASSALQTNDIFGDINGNIAIRANAFAVNARNGYPVVEFDNSAAGTNNKYWQWVSEPNGNLVLRTLDDNRMTVGNAIGISRKGVTLTKISLNPETSIEGAEDHAISTRTASSTLGSSNFTTLGNARGGPLTETLPACTSSISGRTYPVGKDDADTTYNALTYAPNGSDTIAAHSSLVFYRPGTGKIIQCNGSAAWKIIASWEGFQTIDLGPLPVANLPTGLPPGTRAYATNCRALNGVSGSAFTTEAASSGSGCVARYKKVGGTTGWYIENTTTAVAQ